MSTSGKAANMYIIGIDCAVEEKKTGLAQLYFNGEAIRLLKA
ncbi:MAG TPA: hypothetical protein VFT51_14805 [Bacillales bacterium]|nr:hypothetical protein [Bacillales bacterium]